MKSVCEQITDRPWHRPWEPANRQVRYDMACDVHNLAFAQLTMRISETFHHSTISVIGGQLRDQDQGELE